MISGIIVNGPENWHFLYLMAPASDAPLQAIGRCTGNFFPAGNPKYGPIGVKFGSCRAKFDPNRCTGLPLRGEKPKKVILYRQFA